MYSLLCRLCLVIAVCGVGFTSCKKDDDNSAYEACDYNPYEAGDKVEFRTDGGATQSVTLVEEEYEGKTYLASSAGPNSPKAYSGCEGEAVISIAPNPTPFPGAPAYVKTRVLEFPLTLGRSWEASPPSSATQSGIEVKSSVRSTVTGIDESVESFGATYRAFEVTEVTRFVYVDVASKDTLSDQSVSIQRYLVAGEGVVRVEFSTGTVVEQRRVK